MKQTYLTAAQVARMFAPIYSVKWVRDNAPALGGFKIPGGRKWVFTKESVASKLKEIEASYHRGE